MEILFGVLGAVAMSVMGIAVIAILMTAMVYSAELVLQAVKEELNKTGMKRDKD